MTPLIWMLTWLLQAGSAVSELPVPPVPVNVTLSSSHFIHLLTWDPGPGTPRGVFYNVTVYSLSGSSEEPVVGCEHVESPRLCNVTMVFPDHHETYYNHVVAVLDNQKSKPAEAMDGKGFVPISDTDLDPPLVSVKACGNRSLCVELQPPEDRLRDVYNTFHYSLMIKSNSMDGAQFSVDRVPLGGKTLGDLAPRSEYCVSARIHDSRVGRTSAYSPPHCVFTAAEHTADIEISVVLCLLVLSLGVCIPLLVRTGFICLKSPLPEVLTSIRHQERRLVSEPYGETLLSPVCAEPTSPPVGGKQKDTESEGESEGEEEKSSTGGGEGGYDTRLAVAPPCEDPLSPTCEDPLSPTCEDPLSPTCEDPLSPTCEDPLSSTSSSFSSSSSRAGALPHLYPETHALLQHPTVPSTETNAGSESNPPHLHLPVLVPDQQREPLLRPDIQSTSISNNNPLSSMRMTSQSNQIPGLPQCVLWGRDLSLHRDTERDAETVVAVGPGEVEEEEEEERSGLDVNLLSVTLGGSSLSSSHRKEPLGSTIPLLSTQTQGWDTEPEPLASHPDTLEDEDEKEEEDEEEHCGYLPWS